MFRHIPNILSAFRIGLVPVFAITYFSDGSGRHGWALAIFIIAGVTDVIDGSIARKYDLITKIGTVLDPLADKLMQLTAIICLSIDGLVPLWIMMVLMIQEVGMIMAGIYMYLRAHSTVIPSNVFGKGATGLFALAILITILFPGSLGSLILVTLALGLKLMALYTYIHKYYTKIKPGIPR